MHLGIMKTCVLSWIATALLLKPFPVKALSVPCDERLPDFDETQNFDLDFWTKVVMKREHTDLAEDTGFDLNDGMVGYVWIIVLTLYVSVPSRRKECLLGEAGELLDTFELASASTWTDGRTALSGNISSGVLLRLGLCLLPTDLWSFREGEHRELFFPDDACCGSGDCWSMQLPVSDLPAICESAQFEECSVSRFTGGTRGNSICGSCSWVSDTCCGCGCSILLPPECDLPYFESASAAEPSLICCSFLNPSSRKKNSRDDGQDMMKRDNGQYGFASELTGGSFFEDCIVSFLTGWNAIVVSSRDEDVHVCQVMLNSLENRLIRERDNRIRTARLVKQLGVSDEQLWQDASVGSKVESLFGLSMVEPRTAPPLIAADLPL